MASISDLSGTEFSAKQAAQNTTSPKPVPQSHIATRKSSTKTSKQSRKRLGAAPLLEVEEHDKADENEPGTSESLIQHISAGLRLKTSKEVYDLVRTDPGYDAQKCHILYHDRVANRYMRTALSDWTPASAQGDVPWHRVWFFTYDGTIFWDRERRFFDHSLLRRLASGDVALSYQNVTRGAQRLAETLPCHFRVATLNLLTGSENVDLRSQTSDVADVLRDLQADVIMLQGCTKETLEFLQEQDWLCEGYELVYSDLEPSGQITLARAHHARASQYSFSASNKRALKVWFKTANGVDFETWNVDLRFSAERGRTPRTPEGRSSGKATKHSGNGMEQSGKGTEQSGNGRELSGTQKSGTDLISRLEQRTYISGTYAAVVAGEFGFCGRKNEDGGPFSQSADRGWCDAWLSCQHPGNCPVDENSSSQAIEGQPGDISWAVGTWRAVGGRTFSRSERIYTRSSQFVLKSAKNFAVSGSDSSEHFGVTADVHADPSRAVDDWERLETPGR